MESYFEILRSKGLVIKEGPNIKLLREISLKDMEKLAYRLSKATVPLSRESPSGLTHCASLNMSGDPNECYAVDCRLERINKLSRFALLHSSKVYVKNFFDDFLHYSRDIDYLRYIFLGNICLSVQIQQLLETGIFEFSPIHDGACPGCLAKLITGRQKNKKVTDHAIKEISRELLKDFKLTAFTSPVPSITIDSKLGYSECQKRFRFEKIPSWMEPYFKGKKRLLPEAVARKLGFHKRQASMAYLNVSFELALSEKLGASSLFDNPLHLSLISKISRDPVVEKKNSVALKHMTTVMPFADKIPVSKILELRKKEPESFLTFQRALFEGMRELDKAHNLNEREAREIYGDVVQPSLNRLDQTFKNAQKTIIKDVYRNAVAAVGALSVGILSGTITGAVIPALAGAIFAQKTIARAMRISDESEEVRNDKFYFLWKVKRLGR